MNIQQEIRHLIPQRPSGSHKGDFGRVFILAGSLGMSGAAVLASQAALRSGAGLVTAGIPKSLALPLSKQMVEAMLRPLPETPAGSLSAKSYHPIRRFLANQNVLALGPGLSQHPETQSLIRRIVLCSKKTMVIDADGLNAFQGHADSFSRLYATAVLTPHPGEWSRLFRKKISSRKKERIKAACETAKNFNVILVLKGHETVVAEPSGGIFVNSTGNPGMATGGSGDVLLGVIAGLLGQGLRPFDAAKAGVYIHGLAGDLAAKKTGEVSLVAGDLIKFLPAAFKKVLGR